MQEIQYIGEHLLPGQIGKASVMLAFAAAVLSAIAYYFATEKRNTPEADGWKKIGRTAYVAHGIGILGVVGTLFYVMINHYFEYRYVQSQVSADLPFQYIFSAFWGDQEGSFLLWLFWHVVLGIVLIFTAKKWEAPVMASLSLIQIVITSMILGVYVGFGAEAVKFGSNPFDLLRDTMQAPIFAQADYVDLIKGRGLNPLLQNYWMTIHPPTLFLGFASTSIPFCFAMAGLWTRDHKGWLDPVLPWALFNGAILGTGILMGAAWAYEALTFGGYWAWDPVENMSLVPWIVLVAGIHTNLVARVTGYSIKATYLFYAMSFVMIVYSTFLTRSGVLGDTSVHAFTEMGLENQLVAFVMIFFVQMLYLYFSRVKGIPAPEKEENASSKEFWMFIGALVLLFSAVMITASTSLPVYNKIREIFDPLFEGRTILDAVDHFNKYQLWIAVFIGLLSGTAQYLRWAGRNWEYSRKQFFTRIGIAAVVSAVFTGLLTLWINATAWQYIVLLFSGVFAIVTNLDYVIFFAKNNTKAAASAIAHLGFGIMLVGIMASGLNKEHISTNPFAQRGLGLEEEALKKNVLLYKDLPMYMSGYRVTYTGDTLVGNNRLYDIKYEKMDSTGNVTEEFAVQPTILYDNALTKVAAYNPSTKHYLHKDIFTHIATIAAREADMEVRKQFEDTLTFNRYEIPPNEVLTIIDTVRIKDNISNDRVTRYLEHKIELVEILENPTREDYEPQEGDLAVGVKLAITPQKITAGIGDTILYAQPMLVLRGARVYTYPDQLDEISTRIRLHPDMIDYTFTPENQLDYKNATLKEDESVTIGNLKMTFMGVVRDPQHPSYVKQEGDLAVGGKILVEDLRTGESDVVEPIYLIRESRPLILKDNSTKIGAHVRFASINPATETFDLQIAQEEKKNNGIPLEISTKSFRTDYIVLETIIFPGINLVWLGSLMMMIGLLVGMFYRRAQRVDG